MTIGGLLAAGTWIEWILQPSSWLVILQVAGGLGFVIFVHELGHFLVAKACGVKCEKFYLGFDVGGLKLLSFKWGETEYGIGALPLGGYVKMLGQDDNPAAAAAEAQRAKAAGPGYALTSGDLPPEPGTGPHPAWDPRSYPAQSVPKRMAIISAGVIMNVIFAVLMASLAYGIGVREMTCTISSVRTGGVAWRAGLRTGDEIVKIGDRTDPIFNDLRHGVTVGDVKKGIDFTIFRPSTDTTWTVLLKPDTDLGAPTIGVTSPFSLTLPADFGKGLPGAAGRAKPAFEPGDTIRSIDGVAVATYAELLAALSLKPGAPVTLGVDRSDPKAEGTTSRVEIVLPPQPRRVTGLGLTAGHVVAVQDGSPAAEAGIKTGVRITTINDEPIGDPLTLDDRLERLVGKGDVVLSILRQENGDGREEFTEIEEEIRIVPREVTWRDDETTGFGPPTSVASLGIAMPVLSTVAAVVAGSPADRAGIKAGDTLTGVTFVIPGSEATEEKVPLSDKEPNWPVVMAVLQQVPDGTKLRLDLTTASGEKREVEIDPVAAEDQFVVDRGLVFEPVYQKVKAKTVAGAFRRGLQKTGEDLTLVYAFLGKLWSNRISPRLLGGPIEIAKQAGKSAEEGFGRLLLFLTMLSANLAVVNFLPIPVLDGGHMVFLLYELVFRKPPSEPVVAVLSYLGLGLILSLMLFVFGLDLGLIPRR
jgi:regulator of sigma E protease